MAYLRSSGSELHRKGAKIAKAINACLTAETRRRREQLVCYVAALLAETKTGSLAVYRSFISSVQ